MVGDNKYESLPERLDSNDPQKFLHAYKELTTIIEEFESGRLKDLKEPTTTSPYRRYKILYEKYTLRFKELTSKPAQSNISQ